MVHFLILRFLLVLFSFHLIQRCHSIEKKADFDIELELFQNLLTESKSWLLHKMWNKSSRRPRFEQEKEINNIYQESTRNLETMKIIVTPRNNDRFDIWGG